jgi:predicted acyltransferase
MEPAELSGRLVSLDAFRGLAIATTLLVVFGVNAIAAFVLSGLLTRALIFTDLSSGGETLPLQRWIFDRFFAPWALPIHASLAFAIVHVLLIWLVLALLYRRRIFLKV